MNFCIKNQSLSVTVNTLGAELQSINHKGKELLWRGDKTIWGDRSPLLFPIVGRLKNDELKHNGKTYTLKKHGFAAKKQFLCTEKTESKLSFELLSDDATKAMYPFDFQLKVIYTLQENTVKVSYEVANTGTETMYFSIGGHPGFNCMMGDKILFEKKETAKRLVMNEDSYISERKLFLDDENEIIITEDLFNQDALIFQGLQSRYLTLKTKDRGIKVHFEGTPYLGIWAKPKAPYVCIEPWFGADDRIDANCSFDKKEGIVPLETGKSFYYSFDIEVL